LNTIEYKYANSYLAELNMLKSKIGKYFKKELCSRDF